MRSRLGASYYKLLGATTISNLGDGMAQVAYPWLASAVTRNPILVALVAVAQRLPWLVFTLPAGVITDRVDRRRAMVAMDVIRGLLTLVVAFAVLGRQDVLPGPDELDLVAGTDGGLYAVVLVATLLVGMAEVLRDNSGQTIMPNIVAADRLEHANGRMYSVELVTNTFAGPPLGSLLLLAAFSIPFFVDAGTFFAAAALVFLIPGTFRAERQVVAVPTSFRQELAEGVRWLMAHELLRPMAIILGIMNMAAMVSTATFVLFAQEVIGVGPLMFTVIGFGGAIGGIVGGQFASRVSRRLGSGPALVATLGFSALTAAVIGAFAYWPVALAMFATLSFWGLVWNVITVSLRQAIIPPRLLGRVNSVYRFFAWGMMPVGAALGGVIVFVVDRFASRDMALRWTWFANALIHVGLLVFARSKLTTARIENARSEAVPVG